MMEDPKFAPADHSEPVIEPQSEPAAISPESPTAGAAVSAESPNAPPPVSAAVEKFRSCRWRAAPEDGEFCTHRDVLPFAGKEGFVAESWCPDCAFYKLRRTPKKRERVDYSY
jgi:hypothetical protein